MKKWYSMTLALTVLALLLAVRVGLYLQPQPKSAPAANEAVNVWLTTPDQANLLAQQPAIAFSSGPGSSPSTITVDESQTYQQMVGFGASFTDSSAWLVQHTLSATQRTSLLNKLFSTDPTSGGIGLSFLRQPMGASDFTTTGNYSYDDMPAGQTDPTLANFSISHDTAYIIPTLKQALQINPNLHIMATPWSPPGWMKSSGSMIGGTLNPTAYGPYASYFVKFIQAYQAQGLPIYAITPQNEPQNSPTGSPGMLMSSTEEDNFIKNNLGPAFASNGISTKIIVYDHNWDTPGYPEAILGDPDAAQYVAGSAFHCYAGDPGAQSTVHDAYPSKDIYFTECSGGGWAPDFGPDLQWETENLIIGATRNWAKTVTLWNMALDQSSGPQNGGCSNCRGMVTIDQSGNITYNVEYYVLGHISKFVVPGAYRISSNTFGSGGIEDVAFSNPDGSKALVVLNSALSSTTFSVNWGAQHFTYTLPAGAVATFTWSATSSVPILIKPGSNPAPINPKSTSLDNASLRCYPINMTLT